MFCIYNYFYQYFIPVSIMEIFTAFSFFITFFNTCFYHGLRMVEMTEIYLLNFNIGKDIEIK